MTKAKRTGYTDEWSRSIAEDAAGSIYVDVNLGIGREAWHTTTNDGEPDNPIQLDFEEQAYTFTADEDAALVAVPAVAAEEDW